MSELTRLAHILQRETREWAAVEQPLGLLPVPEMSEISLNVEPTADPVRRDPYQATFRISIADPPWLAQGKDSKRVYTVTITETTTDGR